MKPAGALKAFQQRMAAAVMAPLTSKAGMARRRPDGVRMEAEAAAFVKPSDRLTSFERLEIYNRQYWFRILDSFGEDFPGLQAVLGRIRFDGLARAYLTECPSRSFSLRNLGSRLEPWLLAHPAWIEPRRDLALDMARLEWAHIEAFDEAADPVLAGQDLVVDASTRLGLQPYLRLLHLTYPVDDLLRRIRTQATDGASSGNHALVARRGRMVRRVAALSPDDLFLAVHRQDGDLYDHRLEPEDFRLLEGIRSGADLGQAIETAFSASAIPETERPAFLQQAFHRWAALGWFVRAPS